MNKLDELIKRLKLDKDTVAYRRDSYERNAKVKLFSDEIRKSLDIIQPDAVYHFNNQPFILFFDFTGEKDIKREENIQKQVWCFDKSPVVFIIFEDEIRIYNAFRYQKRLDESGLEEIKFDNEEDKYSRFSFWNLQSGNTLKWIQDNFYKKNIKDYRVNQKLLENISNIQKKLTNSEIQSPLDKAFANILILRLIFIRYLIDRGVKIDEQFIKGKTSEERRLSLTHLISHKNKLNTFFEYLEKRFNGNLFETKNDPLISKKHLNELSQIFSAHKNQIFLFDVFDFSIIPIEVISAIYESVIDPKKREDNSAIYTPPFLVDYIISETIEQNRTNEFKVLDPACGSGIFLVQAYRKLVEKNKDMHNQISDARLVELFQNNIFGIDKDINALNVAAFSLYVAMLDYKNPPEIENFELPKLLNTNLFEADFFDEEAPFNVKNAFKEKEFDFIIGNPPWKSKNDKKYDKHHLDYIRNHKIPTSASQIAQTFLARTKDFANTHTRCAFIVTSKALYNLWAKDFRSYFFSNFYVDFIFDLSSVRRWIFEESDNPAMIVFYRYAFGQNTESNIVKHYSVKPNFYLRYFKIMVIERRDRKSVLQKYFIKYDWMLKVALYGNTIDFHFLKKLLSKSFTIKSFIENSDHFYNGDGIKKLTEKALEKLSPKQKDDIVPFNEIADIPIIEIENINEYYSVIDGKKLPESEDLYVKSGRHEEYYRGGERILLKSRPKDESRIVASYIDTDCVYRQRVLGISTKNKIKELKVLYGIFNSKLYTYYQFLTCSSWGIFYPEILHYEYLNFPYIIKIQDKEHFISLVDDLIAYYKEYLLTGKRHKFIPVPESLLEQINKIVNNSYGLSQAEKDLVDYVWEVSRYQFQESKIEKLTKKPLPEDLKKYAKIFYDYFSEIYNENNEYFQIDIYQMPYYAAMKFNIVSHIPIPEKQIDFPKHSYTEETLLGILAQTFSIYELSNKIFLQKDVKGFEEDFFYIIKPNEYKCWHRAIAYYDLAEFADAIEKSERITEGWQDK